MISIVVEVGRLSTVQAVNRLCPLGNDPRHVLGTVAIWTIERGGIMSANDRDGSIGILLPVVQFLIANAHAQSIVKVIRPARYFLPLSFRRKSEQPPAIFLSVSSSICKTRLLQTESRGSLVDPVVRSACRNDDVQ